MTFEILNEDDSSRDHTIIINCLFHKTFSLQLMNLCQTPKKNVVDEMKIFPFCCCCCWAFRFENDSNRITKHSLCVCMCCCSQKKIIDFIIFIIRRLRSLIRFLFIILFYRNLFWPLFFLIQFTLSLFL